MIIVAYDIEKDKPRNKVSRILEDCGLRIQYSLFETDIDPVAFDKVLQKLKSHINVDNDNIKVYFLCKNCEKKIKSIGIEKSSMPDDAVVI